MIGILLCAVLLTRVHTLDTQRWVYKYSVNIYYMQNTAFVFNNCVSFLTIYFVLSILSVQSLLYSKLSEKAAYFFVFIFYCIYFLSYFFACYINIHVHVSVIGKAKNVNGTMAPQLLILMGHFHNERAIYLFIGAIL